MKTTGNKQWNVAFLVKDYPEEVRTVGPSHINGRIGEDFLGALRKLDPQGYSILGFVDHCAASRFV